MSLAARLSRLEVALGSGVEDSARVVLAADGIVRDGDGQVIELPAASDGPLSVVLRRGPEPSTPRRIT